VTNKNKHFHCSLQTLNFEKMSKPINWGDKLTAVNIEKARANGMYVKYPKGTGGVRITGAAAQWAGKGKGTDPTMTYSPNWRVAGPLAVLQEAIRLGQLPQDLLVNAYTKDTAGNPSAQLYAQYMMEVRAREAVLASGQKVSIFTLADVPGILEASKDVKNWVTKDKKTKKAGGAAAAPRRGNIVPLSTKLTALAPGKIINVSKLDASGKGARVSDKTDKMRLKHVAGLEIASNNAAAYSLALDQLVAQGAVTADNAATFRAQFAGGAGAASPFGVPQVQQVAGSPFGSPASSRGSSPIGQLGGSPRQFQS
jgi:hypothetical protein